MTQSNPEKKRTNKNGLHIIDYWKSYLESEFYSDVSWEKEGNLRMYINISVLSFNSNDYFKS